MTDHHQPRTQEPCCDMIDALYRAIVDSHPFADVTYATAILVISYLIECYAAEQEPLPFSFISWGDFPSLFVGGETFMTRMPETTQREVYDRCCELYERLKPIADSHRAHPIQKQFGMDRLLGVLRTHSAMDGGQVFRLVTQTDRFTGD